jgi:hypothetical protein
MTKRTRSLLDTFIAFVGLGLVFAGIYLAASHDVDLRVKAAVDAVQERQR